MTSIGAPTLLAVRARRLAGRRRWRRAFVAAVVVLTAAVVAAQFRAAEAARNRWDGTRVVVVARRDLGPGEVVADDTVELREVAAGSVAPAALDELPVGSVVRYPVAAGEPLVASRLAPDGLTGLAALVPAGDRAVAVPVGPAGRPPLRVGDHVDVLAVATPTALFPVDPVPFPPDGHAHEGNEADAEVTDEPGDASTGEAEPDPDDHSGDGTGAESSDEPADDGTGEDDPQSDDGTGEGDGHPGDGADGGDGHPSDEGDQDADGHPGDGAGRGAEDAEPAGETGATGDPPERPAGAPGATPGVVPLVSRALVVDVTDEVVTVAVPSALAPAVAAAVTQGAVVLTLTGA